LINSVPSRGFITNTLVARASASIVVFALMETLTLEQGEIPVMGFTM
jgi:hypothetical protein